MNNVTESHGAWFRKEIVIEDVPFEAIVHFCSADTIVEADVFDRVRKETEMKPELSPLDSSLYEFGRRQIPITVVTHLPITWKGNTMEVPVVV